MKKLLLFVCFISFFSCNDGDIIVTSFDFDETDLQACLGGDSYVFFKFNQSSTESLSVRLGVSEDLFTTTNTSDNVLDGTTNLGNYRIFTSEVTSAYFCSEIPPTTPEVSFEYTASSGIATIVTTSEFNDADGLPFIDSLDPMVEGTGDYDCDNIPNFYDFDDDGDNVPTAEELDILNLDGDGDPLTNPLDSDGDTIPDYLDEDDDGDGVPTRYEADGGLDPTVISSDPAQGPDYLNPFVANPVIVDEFREHNYNYDSDISLTLNNLVLVNGEEQITRESLFMGTITSFQTGNTLETPNFPTDPCEN